jgi:hypothetical protein
MLHNQSMLGVPYWWFTYMMFQIMLGRSLFMVFGMVLLLLWPWRKFALDTSFDFFPMVFK